MGAGAPPATQSPQGQSPCQSQDIAALYDLYGWLAFSLALGILHDRPLAEEVVQDAFLALWRNADLYDESRGSMSGWIGRIVHNKAVDRLRGRGRHDRACASLDEMVSLRSPLDVVAEVIRREDRTTVMDAVAALPAAQRSVVELAYFSGYSQPEIAAITRTPLGTVKSRTRSAVRALGLSLSGVGAPHADQPGANHGTDRSLIR